MTVLALPGMQIKVKVTDEVIALRGIIPHGEDNHFEKEL